MHLENREKVTFEKIFLDLKPQDFLRPDTPEKVDEPLLEHIENPSYEVYRKWHDDVGKPYGWHERPRINDRDSIEALLSNPKVKMFLLKDGDDPVGYALIEEDKPGQVEISDFGFPPQNVGKGYGSTFFPLLVEKILDEGMERVWLSTRSTNDPKVVSFYERFGFNVYNREQAEELKAT